MNGTDFGTIRTNIKTLIDTVPDLNAGSKHPVSVIGNVPTYYIRTVGFETTQSSTHTATRHLVWEIVVLYDEPTTEAAMSVVDTLLQAIWAKLAGRSLDLSKSVLQILPSSLSSTGEEIIEIGGRFYIAYPIKFTTKVMDNVRY
ncbi:MAG: hypothetical protein WCP97_00535 [bacterium]